MKYTLGKSCLHSKKDIPAMPRWFCDGRLAVKYGDEGVERIEYYIPRKDHGNQIIFLQGIFDCFRMSIKKDGLRYAPRYENVKLYPYGFCADWNIKGEVFQVGLYVLNQNLFFYANGNSEYELRVSFHESTQYIPAFNGDFASDDCGYKRVWKEWKENNGRIYGGFTEKNGDKVCALDMAIIANRPCVQFVTPRNVRQAISVTGTGENFIGVIFDCDEIETAVQKNSNFEELLRIQEERYCKIADNAPQLKTGNRGVDTFFSLAPLYYESLKTVDVKGAIRAKSARYYVWGWDTTMTNLPRCCWQDYTHIHEILEYFTQRADKEKGILHACSFDDSVASYAHLASHGVYINLLENYISMTGDKKALEEYYPCAKDVFERVILDESKIDGLFKGSSLSIDFIDCVKETGEDISCFNNSITYAMTRAMETLASMAGDCETQSLAKKIAVATEKNFFSTFFDKEKGYFVMSVDSETLEQRKVYGICCTYLWDSDYHFDLLGLRADECKKFIKENAFSPNALRDIPVWEDCFDMDANQANSTFPNVDEVLLQLCRMNGLEKGIRIWIKKLGYWMEKLTCPEGESYLYEGDRPRASRWDGENGTWQGFALRKWYTDILEVVLGIYLDGGGLTVGVPYLSYQLSNLVVGGKKIGIQTQGKGKEISCIIVNGKTLSGSLKIPYDWLQKENEIIVVLGEKQPLVLERASGIEITDFAQTQTGIRFYGKGYASKSLFVNGQVEILQDGTPLQIQYLKKRKKSFAKIELQADRMHLFEIHQIKKER